MIFSSRGLWPFRHQTMFWLVMQSLPFMAIAQDSLLPAVVAFNVSANVGTAPSGQKVVMVRYVMKPGYLLYQDRFNFSLVGDELANVLPLLPTPEVRFDRFLNQDVAYYKGEVFVKLVLAESARPMTLMTTAQGCAAQGVCYPPIRKAFALSANSVIPVE